MSDTEHDARWFVFQKDRVLLSDTGSLPAKDVIALLQSHFIREHSLGEYDSKTIYCAEVPENFSVNPPFTFVSLRKALDQLGADWYQVTTKAFTIINWDRNHQFCGQCGNPTKQTRTAFERVCTHCALHFYPRISPSIIVLIRNNDQVLMARGYHFQPEIYGLIAGFVEAGESLEEAVHREVYEETHLRIKNLRYFGSQVWPFPDSLMMGFFADYASGELEIDPKEIEAAGWYRYDRLPGRPTSKISISSQLLDHFIEEQQSKQADAGKVSG